MPFADKSPRQVTEADLLAVIGNEPESKFIDYKRDIIGSSDADKKEFLYDVSSFANTLGGYIVLGVAETAGIPASVVGVGPIDAEKEILIRPPISRGGAVDVSIEQHVELTPNNRLRRPKAEHPHDRAPSPGGSPPAREDAGSGVAGASSLGTAIGP
jgi:hypothetical protein